MGQKAVQKSSVGAASGATRHVFMCSSIIIVQILEGNMPHLHQLQPILNIKNRPPTKFGKLLKSHRKRRKIKSVSLSFTST